MTPLLRTGLVIAALMMAASALAVALRPTHKLADAGPKVDLEAMIPKQFGDWRIDDSIAPVLPSPDVQAKLDKIYNQVLARTYRNSKGQRIMLSIAYGGDQSGDSMQVHRPEYCYNAQGFEVRSVADQTLTVGSATVPVRRLLANKRTRIEPISYWITIGERPTLPGLSRKLTQLRYGLTGTVPDGLLVRVSSIGSNSGAEYVVQDRFLTDMLRAVKPAVRARFVGNAIAK